MELTLQYLQSTPTGTPEQCRNPYFIGINSAIRNILLDFFTEKSVAILILLELTLQLSFKNRNIGFKKSRNPYFIGINSAIMAE